MPHISLAAETLWHIGPLPITNSLIATWTVMVFLTLFSFLASKRLSLIPTSNLSQIAEMILDGLQGFFSSILGHNTKKIFPLAASLFLFIIVANWEGLLPGFGTVGIFRQEAVHTVASTTEVTHTQQAESVIVPHTDPDIHSEVVQETSDEHGITQQQAESVPEQSHAAPTTENGHGSGVKFIPLLRGATADLNMTFALAIVAVLAMQYFGFQTLGIRYSKRFINVSNPIMAFIGILEIISDLSKIISFAFRLFGNIFAGEVLLTIMAFLMPFIAPTPFLFLELFVGFIQAVVFSTLTSVFINVAVAHEE